MPFAGGGSFIGSQLKPGMWITMPAFCGHPAPASSSIASAVYVPVSAMFVAGSRTP